MKQHLKSLHDYVEMLKYIYKSKNYSIFLSSLPVAGMSGTLGKVCAGQEGREIPALGCTRRQSAWSRTTDHFPDLLAPTISGTPERRLSNRNCWSTLQSSGGRSQPFNSNGARMSAVEMQVHHCLLNMDKKFFLLPAQVPEQDTATRKIFFIRSRQVMPNG